MSAWCLELSPRLRLLSLWALMSLCKPLALSAEPVSSRGNEAQEPSRCVRWGLLARPEGGEGFDPIPPLLSTLNERQRSALIEWSSLSLEPHALGVTLRMTQLLDLTEGGQQRLYLIGLFEPCVSDQPPPEQGEPTKQGALSVQRTVRLRSEHPIMAWVDGRGLSLNRVAARTWEGVISSQLRALVIRLSPLAGRPYLHMSSPGWSLEHELMPEAGRRPQPAQGGSFLPPLRLGVSWRVELSPFGGRVVHFEGATRSKGLQPPEEPSLLRDASLLEGHLNGACESLTVQRAGWRRLEAQGQAWRYELKWSCHLDGARATLVSEAWRRQEGGLQWSLDRGRPSGLFSWYEAQDWSGWSLSSSWSAPAVELKRALAARASLSGEETESVEALDVDELRGALGAYDRLTAEGLAESKGLLLSEASRRERELAHAPQPVARRWGGRPLPSALSAQLAEEALPLWRAISYEVSPIARLSQPQTGRILTPLEVALKWRSTLSGWCARRWRGASATLISWAPPSEALSLGVAPRPLPFLGIRCGERDLSLSPTLTSHAHTSSEPPLTPLPEGAWCLDLEGGGALRRCAVAPPALKLFIQWSPHGSEWRARWSHSLGDALPPEWLSPPHAPSEVARVAERRVAPLDLLWESERPPLSSLSALSVLGWWSLPQPLAAPERATRWRQAISTDAREVEGVIDSATLSPVSPTAPLRLLSGEALGNPLRSVDFQRIIDFPAEHPAVTSLRCLKAQEVHTPFGSYLRSALTRRRAPESGWRLKTQLMIAEPDERLQRAAHLSFARDVTRVEGQLWRTLAQSLKAGGEGGQLCEEWD